MDVYVPAQLIDYVRCPTLHEPTNKRKKVNSSRWSASYNAEYITLEYSTYFVWILQQLCTSTPILFYRSQPVVDVTVLYTADWKQPVVSELWPKHTRCQFVAAHNNACFFALPDISDSRGFSFHPLFFKLLFLLPPLGGVELASWEHRPEPTSSPII